MKLKDLFDFVRVNNIDLNTDLGYIDDNSYCGDAYKITVLVDDCGNKLLCLDGTLDIDDF